MKESGTEGGKSDGEAEGSIRWYWRAGSGAMVNQVSEIPT